MNIDDLTYGELKQIAAMFSQATVQKEINPVVGKYCVARCYSAGVHVGKVESVDGENVVLTDSVRLWSWKAKDGVALSGVAQSGIKKDCKIDINNPIISLSGVCELIPCSEDSKRSIYEQIR